MHTAQIIILILLAIGLIRGLWTDLYGVKEREPGGFSGVIVTLVVTAALFYCYMKAGALTTIFQ